MSSAGGGALGVADGVGGWAESGINPAEYSRTFMRVACAYIEGNDARTAAKTSPNQAGSFNANNNAFSQNGTANATIKLDPRGALDTAHKLTKVPGSATACVLQLCPEKKTLMAANLVSALHM